MRVRPVGATAALLDVAPGSAAGWRSLVLDLVSAGALPAPDEVVPGHATLLVDGVPADAVRAALRGRSGPEPAAATGGDVVEIPTVYDGQDLAAVAGLWGLDTDGAVRRHAGTKFTVEFCGFAPGFAYLLGLDGEVPRRASPRTRVPAGAVGLAGRYCGVYPSASPGGWQLVGRTGVRLFDVSSDAPALLPPGTRVRFRPVDHQPDPEPPGRAADLLDVDTPQRLEVVRGGVLSTVQDLGRPGHAHLGVPRSGALDGTAARLANRLVGNPEDAALLETTLDGVAVRAETATVVAVTGAPSRVQVGGRDTEWGVAVRVPAGAVVDVGPALTGVRSYLAVAGGVATRPVLGSRATDTLSGLGPPRLTDGLRLPVGAPKSEPPSVPFTVPRGTGEVILRLLPGPDTDWFTADGLRALTSARYAVSAEADRVGARLDGPEVCRARDGELASAGMVLGAVQVPPDGRPVVFLADHPTTGGYPVAGVVDPRDIAALAQARPGSPVRFHAVPQWRDAS